METGFVLLFFGWAIYLLTVDENRWLARGLCWAGMMWMRPDGCVYIMAFGLAELLFIRIGSRRNTLASLARSAGDVCLALRSVALLGLVVLRLADPAHRDRQRDY